MRTYCSNMEFLSISDEAKLSQVLFDTISYL